MSNSADSAAHRPRIAVDAMGGDHAPASVVEGVTEAAKAWGDKLDLILVGDETQIKSELHRLHASHLSLDIVHAAQRVEMDEGAADSFRRKRDSSLNVATRLVRDGKAEGVFSAGNTGAMVASSLLNLGRIPGVNRPAIATLVPTLGSPPWIVMLDVGAAVDCKPLNLLQFAILGEVYARMVLGVKRPRVGLLNIGEESNKGSELAQEAYPLLAQSGVHFIGNVEGSGILRAAADVVVTDGFTGNIVLKFVESLLTLGVATMREELGENFLAKMGAVLLKPSLNRFRERFDYSNHGAAPLLGVNGVALIGHGRSSPKAIRNAMGVAGDLLERGVIEEIRGELERAHGGRVVSS